MPDNTTKQSPNPNLNKNSNNKGTKNISFSFPVFITLLILIALLFGFSFSKVFFSPKIAYINTGKLWVGFSESVNIERELKAEEEKVQAQYKQLQDMRSLYLYYPILS
jgi:hypothetical protein